MERLRIFLKPNLERANTAAVLREAVRVLREHGAVPMLAAQDLTALGDMDGCETGDAEELLSRCDILMPVGGDGTVLRAAGDALRADKPLIGINAGQVGFLTQLEPGELGMLRQLVEGDYTVSARMLLEVSFTDANGTAETHLALNDIVVRREDTNRILTFAIFDGDQLVLRQRADGVIFATPTGSTAYSLSAGGPIVSPDLAALVVTPICPYGMFHGALVLPPEHRYVVVEQGGQDCGFALSVDGGHLGCRHRVQITGSARQMKLIDLGHRGFYRNVNDKLNQF